MIDLNGKKNKNALLILFITGVCFLSLTLFFGINDQPFSDKKYIAHQGREFITHNLCSVMLMLFFLTFLEEKVTCYEASVPLPSPNFRLIIYFIFSSFISIIIPVFLYFQLQDERIVDLAQQQWLRWDLLTFHFFEHFLYFIYVSCLTMLLYLGVIKHH